MFLKKNSNNTFSTPIEYNGSNYIIVDKKIAIFVSAFEIIQLILMSKYISN